MKKTLFIFLCFIICGIECSADILCREEERKRAQDEFFYKNKDKQIDGENFYKLDEQGQREARIRNLCFGATLSWYSFCSIFEYCKVCEKEECATIPENQKIGKYTFKEYCNLAKTDCFNDNIDKIFSLMEQSNDPIYNMFNPDMNDITKNIAKGEKQITVIDVDHSVCYKTDDNGDTVWHAFVKNNKDSHMWQNLCLSYLKDTNFKAYIEAIYKTKNKNGKTAVQEAINKGNAENLLEVISWYFKQERFDCDDLAKTISLYNDIPLEKSKQLIKQCY